REFGLYIRKTRTYSCDESLVERPSPSAPGKEDPCPADDLAGVPPLGTFVFSNAEDIVEVIGLCGLDFVNIDREHSPKSWDVTVSSAHRQIPAGGLGEWRPKRQDRQR